MGTSMRATILVVTLLSVMLAAGGCAGQLYKGLKPGKLEGKVIVEWMEPDEFLFTPSTEKPLRFTRSDGKVIEPGVMYTDGGSIPRPLWVFRNYSPWGYGPAFVIHDWLFHQNQCKSGDWRSWDVDTAATVMAEAMKTMMLDPKFR